MSNYLQAVGLITGVMVYVMGIVAVFCFGAALIERGHKGGGYTITALNLVIFILSLAFIVTSGTR